ncbi:MAG: TonB-dependent receptor [Bacteroidales bacterium]|nr:TonB-dependent receptor [Bacteroidales bacterium]
MQLTGWHRLSAGLRAASLRLAGLLLICLFHHALFSQDPGRKISLGVKRMPLSEVLEQISGKGDIRFSYSSHVIPVHQEISYTCKDKRISEVLNEILGSLGIEWLLVENQIVLKLLTPAGQVENSIKVRQPQVYAISGYLHDSLTGEALIGANIMVRKLGKGTTTNEYGFYSLSLPSGSHEVEFSFLGFREAISSLNLMKDTLISPDLQEASVGMREVVIRARDNPQLPAVNQPGDFNFSGATLERLPGFAGDVDVLKALQLLPGIRTFGDGSSLYYVRGGNNDQNLLMIDEAPIYNPSHLFGFYSVLAPDAVNDMEIYKGDFPARYGGRASSVINITAREGNMKRFSFGGNLGPYASSLTVEGPIVKDKASFIVSGRLSTLNWLNYLVDDAGSFDLYFFDINAKINVKPTRKDRIFFTFFTGRDQFNRFTNSVYRTYGISWDNMAATLRWNHLFNPKLFSNTTLNFSNYDYSLFLSSDHKSYWQSSIGSITLKSDFTWFLNPSNTLRAGFAVSRYHSNPGNISQEGEEEQLEVREVSEYTSMEYLIYLSNEQKIGNRLSLQYGIRLPVWQNFGPSSIYFFDPNFNVIDTVQVGKNTSYDVFFSPEPRVSLGFALNKSSSLKASYSRTTQFIQQLSTATGPFTSLEVWVPVGQNIQPLKTDQVTLGYFLKFASSNLYFSAEAFYKYFRDHIDYTDHANLLYNPLLEGELRFGNAWSYGLEVMLQKPVGKLSGWIGYTWSRAMTETAGVNAGDPYPASFDSPHNLCMYLSYDTRKRWSFSANWVFMTGNPITSPVGFYLYNGSTLPLYGAKNNDRLPDYHRLDLSVVYRLNKPDARFRHNLAITLYNAYGKANPFSVSFNKYQDGQGNFVVPSNLEGDYELVPTMISVAGIIPSLNYQFKF